MLDQAESILGLPRFHKPLHETLNTPNGITYKVDVHGGRRCEVMSRESF